MGKNGPMSMFFFFFFFSFHLPPSSLWISLPDLIPMYHAHPWECVQSTALWLVVKQVTITSLMPRVNLLSPL